VRLIGRELIDSFSREHPNAKSALKGWTQAIESNGFQHFVDLRRIFGTADHVKPHTVFNIAGNKYRLIALVHYSLQSVVVEEILTHRDYDKGQWRRT